MQRIENLQQFQQAIQQPISSAPMSGTSQFASLGKIVESVDMVKATDIPMDGNMYYFPTADGNMIFGKQWMANGQTRILTFKPIIEDDPNNLSLSEKKLKIGISDEATEVFMDVLNQINARLDVMESALPKTNNRTRAKKEEVAND